MDVARGTSGIIAAAVAERLARLAPDQRAAATAPPGPVLCVAPAGSGKTTTLVARVVWLVSNGCDPATICAITFNRRAAEELAARLADALASLGLPRDAVRVRTFHALCREILRSAGSPVEPLVDRMTLLRRLESAAGPAGWRRLDDAISRLKLDLGVRSADVAADPGAGPIARAFVAYEATLARMGGLDYDDLIVRALDALRGDAELLAAWRARCAHLLVDEVQDVDRSQLGLALLLAAPDNRIFLVGDDDQSIYGWRLADVRRVLSLAEALPGLRRVDLQTNYRCPTPVVERAVRLVAHNAERFAKTVRARPDAAGRLVLAADHGDEETVVRAIVASWPRDGTHAVLARTNRELLVALAVALDLELPFRADRLPELATDPRVDELLAAADATDPRRPNGTRVLDGWRALADGRPPSAANPPGADAEDDRPDDSTVVAAVLAWVARHGSLAAARAAVATARERLIRLHSDDAALSLATVHATKGLEFDDVVVLGMSAGRFPSSRSVAEAADPVRALEEERRLAYVAWTRARRCLTLVYDAGAASPFLREAFDRGELDVRSTPGPSRAPPPRTPPWRPGPGNGKGRRPPGAAPFRGLMVGAVRPSRNPSP